MKASSSFALQYKLAENAAEFEQIHLQNYATFVEEIPQHEPSASRRLVDKFHDQNTYVICLSGTKLLGMLALRGERPFSLDQKIADLDSYLPAGSKVLEIRLLAVKKECRGMLGGRILKGMLAMIKSYGVPRGYDVGIISGTTRQLKLYRHLGFTPFGSLVGSGQALYQPMYVTLLDFDQALGRDILPTV
ncbi:MAG: hypothetical protein L3J39_02620 [Verrucomicrobiales bacterium]|nr:hypothetical protein [Verrucomicrobiales bacterium]